MNRKPLTFAFLLSISYLWRASSPGIRFLFPFYDADPLLQSLDRNDGSGEEDDEEGLDRRPLRSHEIKEVLVELGIDDPFSLTTSKLVHEKASRFNQLSHWDVLFVRARYFAHLSVN